jgi:thymidine phosphorylase
MTLPQELIRAKRDGQVLTGTQVQAFVQGLVDGGFADAQAGAMAMAILLRGMSRAETVALTRAMTHSGRVLDWRSGPWRDAVGSRPVIDKHSTGGVGDKVSLMLAPLLAACGAAVPMISGRGLGHTGGTLDKLEALPGYTTTPDDARFQQTLRTAGCAIVGASADLAPADRRLYAIRDVTATVESLPLITASILSKKLAAGLQGLVLDVKTGSGAVMQGLAEARALAQSLVEVACAAGLPTVALLTDMDSVLGRSAGNALEVQEALDFLAGHPGAGGGVAAGGGGGHSGATGMAGALTNDLTNALAVGSPTHGRDPRLLELTLALAGECLAIGGLAADAQAGQQRAAQALQDGSAAEHFARMVAGLGGPADVFRQSGLPQAPVQREVPAPRGGWLTGMDTRALGLAVVALGGGRQRPGQAVDPRVGLSHIAAIGQALSHGEPLARVHAADEASAHAAVQAVLAACRMGNAPCTAAAVVQERVTAPMNTLPR